MNTSLAHRITEAKTRQARNARLAFEQHAEWHRIVDKECRRGTECPLVKGA